MAAYFVPRFHFMGNSADLYRRLNRPHPEVTFARLVDGLIACRQAYSGKLWVEVMLMRSLNDTSDSLREVPERENSA